MTRKSEEMLAKFFLTQWKYPSPGDWTEQVKEDLNDFGMLADFDFMRSKSRDSFKNLVKKKAVEYAFYSFMEMKNGHSKLDNLFYTSLSTQEY